MWKNIDYENSIEPAMDRLRRTDTRCEKCEEKIVDNWGPDWRTEMDGDQAVSGARDCLSLAYVS